MVLTVTPNPTIDKTLEAPHFRVGDHARVRVRAIVPAGKGINVARGLAALGGQAAACAFVGRNEASSYGQLLESEGIPWHFVPVEGVTRSNTTVLDPVNHTVTHLREEGFCVGREQVVAMRTLLEGLLTGRPDGGAQRIVFCGSLPRGMEPDDLAGLVSQCRQRGAQVVVDANGPALRQAVLTGAVHTVKPNLEELGECLGARPQAQDAPARAEELLDWVDTVLLTLGADGAYVITKGLRYGLKCDLPRDRVRNTVGAGDAFLAGWLRGCELCDDPRDALRWAVAAGAACVTSDTTVGYTRRDVEALLDGSSEI